MSPQIASLRLCKVTSLAFVWLFSTVRLKCLLNQLWSAQAKSHGLHSFYFSPVWVFKCIFKWPACSLRGYKVTLVAFVWFFSTVCCQMFVNNYVKPHGRCFIALIHNICKASATPALHQLYCTHKVIQSPACLCIKLYDKYFLTNIQRFCLLSVLVPFFCCDVKKI